VSVTQRINFLSVTSLPDGRQVWFLSYPFILFLTVPYLDRDFSKNLRLTPLEILAIGKTEPRYLISNGVKFRLFL